MKKFLILLVCLSSLSVCAQQDNPMVIGTVDTIHSNILHEKRVIYVHVPHGSKGDRYPVLYVLDAEDHFQSAVAIDEQMSGVIPPMIVVGITNTNRERDMTPTHVKADKLVNEGYARSSGGDDNFLGFIGKELIPYIDGHYPTTIYRVISGHSLGGLAVLNAFFNHPDLFKAYIAIDPSIWWDQQRWIKKYETALPGHDFGNKSLFVAIANNIPPGMDTISVLKDTSGISPVTQAVLPFVHALHNAKPVGLRWSSKFYPTERHGTVELMAEYDGLLSLFSFYHFSTMQFIGHPEVDQDSALAAHYKRISEIMGYKVEPSESTVNDMAYSCMEQHRMDVAYKLFIRNTQNHPESSNAFDSLGDYYSANGDKKHAIEAYSKSLSLQETEDTRRKLNEMKK
ncbi:MAG TPA: alpha/beta hydrolase-fold protein [Mucilaginibacter sp.]|nr:alpha/beta hydrolase-fold protein [Mucilaginibacter sp.]